MGSGREIPMDFFTVFFTVTPMGIASHMVPVMGPKFAAASYADFCWAPVLSGGRSDSVSYTHLDVYKRQPAQMSSVAFKSLSTVLMPGLLPCTWSAA